MKAIVGRAGLNDTTRSGNDKYAAAILAVVGDGIFAPQMVEGQDIGNTATIEVDLCATETPSSLAIIVPLLQWTLIGLVAGQMLEKWVGFVKRSTVDWLSRSRKLELIGARWALVSCWARMMTLDTSLATDASLISAMAWIWVGSFANSFSGHTAEVCPSLPQLPQQTLVTLREWEEVVKLLEDASVLF